MRIAIVSDIHGNLPALDAVLADIASLGADAIVNLGDIASGPLWPRETLQRLMPLGLPTIAGNHERQLLALADVAVADRRSDALAARALEEPERAWLRGLPQTLKLAPGVEACHGTPGSDCAYLLETVTDDFGRAGSRGIRAATPEEVEARIGGPSRPEVMLCGHSHVPRVLRLGDGRLVINPGSVGLPAYDDDQPWPHWVESDGPDASWGWIEERAGGWHAELCRSRYDAEAAARRAESLGRGDWADALRTGRVGRTEAEVMRAGEVMGWMSDPRVGWALAALALVAGYAGWGVRGLVLAVTVIVFWLLLQFNRALRVMRNAAQAPVGSVPSAVMLHARLKPGMALIQILPIAGSLGRRQPGTGEPGDEHYVWEDAGGRRLEAVLRKGRLRSWQLDAEAAEEQVAVAEPAPKS